MSSYSPFTLSLCEASQLVKQCKLQSPDNRRCYLLQLSFRVVYGDGTLPQACYKKLPRLINGIPLGAGKLSQSQAKDIRWRYLEGGRDLHSFLSVPITLEEADETRRAFRDGLVRQAKVVFGDITVKTNMMLSQCLNMDSDMFINDIADSMQEGLHFHD